MRCLTTVFVFGLTSLAFAESSTAADLPASPPTPSVSVPAIAPVPDWSGFYLGIEGGGVFGSSKKNFSNATSTGDFTVDGAIGGGTVGYNHEWGPIVAGLEGDFSASGVSGKTTCPTPTFTCETNTSWLATVRPRLGYSLGNVMFYATGGLAVGDVNVRSYLNATGGGGVDFTKTEVGWTAGAGAEMSIYSNWSLKAEYLYVRLTDTDGPGNVAGLTTTTSLDENIFRGGLNYSFK